MTVPQLDLCFAPESGMAWSRASADVPHARYSDSNRTQIWYEFWRDAEGRLVLRFPMRATFVLPSLDSRLYSPTGRASRVEVLAFGFSRASVEAIFAQQVRPLLLSMFGFTVLHAAAFGISRSGVCIVGRSQMGKSTLSFALATRSHHVICDDSLVVATCPPRANFCLEGLSSGLRLWPDSVEALSRTHAAMLGDGVHTAGKFRFDSALRSAAVDANGVKQCQSLPLGVVYVLERRNAIVPSFRALGAAEACVALLESSFVLDPGDRQHSERLFAMLTEMVRVIPVFAFDYPRTYEQLDDVCAALELHASRTVASA